MAENSDKDPSGGFKAKYDADTEVCTISIHRYVLSHPEQHHALANKLVEAGRASGERVWNFPFDADFDSDLESKVADIVQCAVDGKGDHILAARFLSRFVPENVAWAHVDLSSATRSGGLGHISTEVTGFGVRFTLEALLRQGLLDGLERPK